MDASSTSPPKKNWANFADEPDSPPESTENVIKFRDNRVPGSPTRDSNVPPSPLADDVADAPAVNSEAENSDAATVTCDAATVDSERPDPAADPSSSSQQGDSDIAEARPTPATDEPQDTCPPSGAATVNSERPDPAGDPSSSTQPGDRDAAEARPTPATDDHHDTCPPSRSTPIPVNNTPLARNDEIPSDEEWNGDEFKVGLHFEEHGRFVQCSFRPRHTGNPTDGASSPVRDLDPPKTPEINVTPAAAPTPHGTVHAPSTPGPSGVSHVNRPPPGPPPLGPPPPTFSHPAGVPHPIPPPPAIENSHPSKYNDASEHVGDVFSPRPPNLSDQQWQRDVVAHSHRITDRFWGMLESMANNNSNISHSETGVLASIGGTAINFFRARNKLWHDQHILSRLNSIPNATESNPPPTGTTTVATVGSPAVNVDAAAPSSTFVPPSQATGPSSIPVPDDSAAESVTEAHGSAAAAKKKKKKKNKKKAAAESQDLKGQEEASDLDEVNASDLMNLAARLRSLVEHKGGGAATQGTIDLLDLLAFRAQAIFEQCTKRQRKVFDDYPDPDQESLREAELQPIIAVWDEVMDLIQPTRIRFSLDWRKDPNA